MNFKSKNSIKCLIIFFLISCGYAQKYDPKTGKLIQEKHEASDEMINQFVNHWTESNKSGRLMKFEMQKTFDISRRLAKWKANDLEWNIESQKNKKSFLSRFKKTPTGYWKAYCSRCNKKELPNNEWQLRQGSSCCAVDYMPEKVNA